MGERRELFIETWRRSSPAEESRELNLQPREERLLEIRREDHNIACIERSGTIVAIN